MIKTLLIFALLKQVLLDRAGFDEIPGGVAMTINMKPENSRDFCVARLHKVYRDLKWPMFNSHTNIDSLVVVCKRLTIGIQRTQV